MLDLALAVACSLMIGMIFKHAARKEMDRMALLTVNYATAALLAIALLGIGMQPVGGGLAADSRLLLLGVGTGILFIAGFFVLAVATQVAGMGLAIGVQRVSVVIPFFASWIIWHEVPTTGQKAGLALASVAFFLIARRKRPGPGAIEASVPSSKSAASVSLSWPSTHAARAFVVLALLFVLGGLVDTFMKTFDEVFAAESSRALFLLMVFGVAFVIGCAFVLQKGLRKGRWLAPNEAIWGALLGLVNYGSVEFLLRAIRQLSGPFVFPANNIALVIGAALLGIYFWDERLSRWNWTGLLLAVLALYLLSR